MTFVRTIPSALMLALFVAVGASAQPVTKAPDATAPFADRLAWGTQQAGRNAAAWVGYRVRSWSPGTHRSWYGTYRGDDDHVTVADVLGIDALDDLRRADGMRASDHALFLRVERGQVVYEELTLRSLESHADFDGLPIYWLGPVETDASTRWLIARFGEARTVDAREELVSAVGVHRSARHTLDFLTSVAQATQRDRDVRESAVFWLSQQGTTDVLPLLDRLARTDRDEDVREQAVFAISQVGGSDAMARLTRLAEDTTLGGEVRENAVFWLGQEAGADALPLLDRLVRRDGDEDVRNKAVFAISQVEDSRATDLLKALVLDERVATGVREDATFWLGNAGGADVLPFLLRLARTASDDDVQEKAIFAISQVDDTDAAQTLIALAQDASLSGEARETAVFWLGQTGGMDAMEPLLKLARDDADEDVRGKAVFAIGQIDGDAATETLITLARTADRADVQEEAVFWLGQRAADRAGETIQSIAFDASTTAVQEKAVFALSQLPDDEGVPRLIEVARTHPNSDVRERAIFWLSQSDDRRAEDAIVKLARGE